MGHVANLNDRVRFKWNAPTSGEGFYVAYLKSDAARLGIAWENYPKPKQPDADGWVRMQLHEFMEYVYPSFRHGYPTGILNNSVEFVD